MGRVGMEGRGAPLVHHEWCFHVVMFQVIFGVQDPGSISPLGSQVDQMSLTSGYVNVPLDVLAASRFPHPAPYEDSP